MARKLSRLLADVLERIHDWEDTIRGADNDARDFAAYLLSKQGCAYLWTPETGLRCVRSLDDWDRTMRGAPLAD
jgi:hypothetical protein